MKRRQPPLVVIPHPFLYREACAHLKKNPKISARLILSSHPLSDAPILITLITQKIDRAFIKKNPWVRVIANYGVGLDNIDLDACKKFGIRVVHTPHVLTRATAELALALLLATAKRIPEGEKLCRTGRFRGVQPDLLLGVELQGKNAVLVGAGRIGRETACLFRAIGLRTTFITRKHTPAQIRSRLRQAHVLSLHMPLRPDTRHWLNRERIRCLSPDAIVINTARGPVIDEKALITALKKRQIFGAGLDVYEREPHLPAALRALSNVVLLPHLGSATTQTRTRMLHVLLQGALDVYHGKHPWNEVKFDS